VIRAVWNYRGLVAGLVRRDLRLRSLRAAWGGAWLVIQPALQIGIYTLVFSRVLAARLPGVDDPLAYSLYLCAGLLPWTYFQEIVLRSQTLFLEHAHLLKAIYFPRSTLPLALLGTATLNFALVAGIFLLLLLALGRWPGTVLLAALPGLAALALLALGLGVLTGTLNVFFRDVGHAVAIALQFWFWLTPIVYPLAIVPEALRGLLAWNPLLPLVTGFQRVVVEHAAPAWDGLALAGAAALGAAAVGWGAFRALSADLVDEL
jgi:lipopolysaccharide transport system permease protein